MTRRTLTIAALAITLTACGNTPGADGLTRTQRTALALQAFGAATAGHPYYAPPSPAQLNERLVPRRYVPTPTPPTQIITPGGRIIHCTPNGFCY